MIQLNGEQQAVLDADILCAPGDMLVRQKDGTHTRSAYLSGKEEVRIIEAVEKQYGRPKFGLYFPSFRRTKIPLKPPLKITECQCLW